MNCTDDDQNDIPNLVFGYVESNTTLTNFTFDTLTGNLTVNISTDSDVGDGKKRIVFTCSDGIAQPDTAEMNFTITAVNDAPLFINLNNTINAIENSLFTFIIQAGDEEKNYPLHFNVTFINCTTASWSSRNSTNCTLFNITQYNSTAALINFTPSNDDVGNYTIEFNVTDAGNTVQPYNASRTRIVSFNVVNVNNLPILSYVCDNERNSTEDNIFSCIVNATDTDEIYNLTFISNTTWFTFNNSKDRITIDILNYTAESNISFIANDSIVGIWYINISVNDSQGGIDSTVINFNISNLNDSVSLGYIANNFDSYTYAEFYLEVNASDDDLRIPIQGYSIYRENITFITNITNLTGGTLGVNTSLFTIIKNVSKGTIGNTSFAYIKFTPTDADAGNYTVNITVRDANNYSIDSKVFNLTIYANNPPLWINLTSTSFTFNESSLFTLNLSENATDYDGDNITFSDNTWLFEITQSGYISISPSIANDSNVGTHNVIITITDSKGASNSSSFTFIIRNINETPILFYIPTPQNATEDELITINLSATDEDLSLTTAYSATDFYPENLKWNINSTTSWFSQTKLNFSQFDNKTASISFTPNKTDIGIHTINITINDSTGKMDSQEFILIISEKNHAPWFTYTISSLNVTLNSSNEYSCEECIDINVSDIEDGNDYVNNTNFTFSSNETWFIISENTGKVNFTVNQSYIKPNGWWINISVTDNGINGSGNLTNSTIINVIIYEYNLPPTVEKFAPTVELNVEMEENSSKMFGVIVYDENANPPNSDSLNITWKIDGIVNKTENIVNGSSSTIIYCTNFTDETTNKTAHNVSVWVYDSQNNLTIVSWNVSVNHTNAPVKFFGNINNLTISSTSYVNVTCNIGAVDGTCTAGGTSVAAGGYFSDIDHTDAMYNHSINFTFYVMDKNCNITLNESNISVNIDNNTLILNFYTSVSVAECFNITAFDYENLSYNVTSNNFLVNLTVTPPTPSPTPTPKPAEGGGGGRRKIPIALKIIVPEPVTMFTVDRIVVPIALQNVGRLSLIHI